MNKTKNLKLNKKTLEKFIKLPFIFIGICLLIFLFSGCISKTQRYAEEITTPGEAIITIIEHDISGNDGNDSNRMAVKTALMTVTGKTTESFIENRIENMPYYFIAIHNEPGSKPGGEKNIEESFNYLAEMIAKGR